MPRYYAPTVMPIPVLTELMGIIRLISPKKQDRKPLVGLVIGVNVPKPTVMVKV
jgi:hypothetical protein